MSDPTRRGGADRGNPGQDERPLFRDDPPRAGDDDMPTRAHATHQPPADAGPHPTAVLPGGGRPGPFPPLRRPVGEPDRRPAAAAPDDRPGAYPPQPPLHDPARARGVPPGGAPPARHPGGAIPVPPPRRRRRFGRRRVLILLLVLLIALPAGLYLFADSRLNRVEAFPASSTRPAATPGQDWLIVGSDSREGLSKEERKDLATGSTGGQRADTMMLLHIPDSGGGPTLVSLPRDSYVEIPGRGMNRLNAAFAFGGAKLLTRTVEELTDIRVDHYAEIGFGGLFNIVNAVGGVEMCIDKARKDPKAALDIEAGCQQLDGGQALGVARSRESTRGDLDRVNAQRELIGAIFDKATSPSTLINPWRSVKLALSGSDALTVHDGDHLHHLARLAWAMRSLNSDGTTTTVPIGREFSAGGAYVIGWDEDRAEALFGALREDRQVPKSARMD